MEEKQLNTIKFQMRENHKNKKCGWLYFRLCFTFNFFFLPLKMPLCEKILAMLANFSDRESTIVSLIFKKIK